MERSNKNNSVPARRILKPVLLVFLFMGTRTFSQVSPANTGFHIMITDTARQLIENANVKILYKNKSSEVVPAPSGKIDLTFRDTSKLESVSISHVGFQTLVLNTNQIHAIFQSGSSWFQVVMKKREQHLEQVEIISTQPFYQKDGVTVLDYEITADGNFILVMEKLIFLMSPSDDV